MRQQKQDAKISCISGAYVLQDIHVEIYLLQDMLLEIVRKKGLVEDCRHIQKIRMRYVFVGVPISSRRGSCIM